MGQGVWTVRPSGGLGMISIWVTERAPWRIEVPTQSEPVSPPPMTTTSLPVARMASASGTMSPARRLIRLRQEVHGEHDAAGVAARDGQVARSRGPAGQDDGVEGGQQMLGRIVDAHVDAGPELDALRGHEVEASVEHVSSRA